MRETVFVLKVPQGLGKVRQGRQCAVGLNIRKLRSQFVYYLLDQEIAKRNAPQASQAVIDRVKDRGIRFFGR